MALPQSVDPTTLNLSGKPTMATAPTTTTSEASTGMPNPTIVQEKSNVSPLLGALFGGALGMKYANSQAGKAGTGTGATNTSGSGSLLSDLIKAVTSGKGTPTGNIGSVSNVIVPSGMSGTEAQNWLNQNYGTTNGQPNYVVSGTNLSTGEIVGLPNDKIGGTNLGTNTGNFGHTADGTSSGTTTGGTTGGTTNTGTLTNIGSGYFMDDNSNVYDSNGTLIYQNPSIPNTGTQTEPSGGGYDPAQDQYFQDSSGDIYDGLGNLVLAYNNGYYYEPDTGNFYDSSTWDVVDDSFDPYTDYFNIPTTDDFFGSGWTDSGGSVDMGGYGTDWTTTWVKDGGSINKGGLPTPLFANGGGVKGYADGSIIEAATNMAPSSQLGSTSTPVATASTTANTTSNTSGTGNILDSILGFAQNNPTLTGAGLGALLTQLINSNASYPVNKGVDMAALGAFKPRTTPTGAARFVPYSEYGTPTSAFDYSTLYNNLGVSPFGGGAVSPSTPTSAAPTPTMPVTAPTGGLPTGTTPVSPTSPTVTTPTTSTPTYFADADGNIYDADGNLVYDATTGTSTGSTGTAVAPTASTTPSSGLAVPSLPTTTIADASYSYGTPVSPSEILGSKKGGLAVKKMADGGMSDLAVTSLDYTPYYDKFISSYDPSGNTTRQSIIDTIHKLNPYMLDSDIDNMVASDPYHAQALLGSDAYLTYGVGSDKGNYYDGLDHPNYTGISTGLPSEETVTSGEVYTPLPYERNDVSVTSTGTDFPPVKYNQGMPQQVQDLMPPQNQPAMPTQGALMPQQTPFSSSPTFRFSGANNPLLTGLRQSMPNQQPFMLMPNGTFAPREEISTSRQYGYSMGGQPITDNLNVPVSNRPFQNVPAVQGRGDYRTGAYVEGAGDGQSDDIPAMLADGEYVIDAETVAQLGNGSNKAGAKILDDFRKNIRAHKRSAPHDKIPPKSKSALAYLKGAK